MITDKQIIDTVKNIKNICNQHACVDCIFKLESNEYDTHCQIMKIAFEMTNPPSVWNIEKLERIIKQ